MRTYGNIGETSVDGPYPNHSNSLFKNLMPPQSLDESTFYRFEKNRLETFETWPSTSPIDKARLAKAGFFYLKQIDAVKCFSCKIELSNWREGDSAYHRHRNASPNCQFVKGDSDNEPMISNFRIPAAANTSQMVQVNGHVPNGIVSKPCSIKKTSSVTVLQNGSMHHASYNSEECRLKTFKGWPHAFLNPEKLAEAGFYFLRHGDRVQCAFCHGIVHDWEPNDDPMVEHWRHFPFCEFVQGKPVGNVARNKRLWYNSGGQDIAGNTHVKRATIKHQRPSQLREMGINELSGPCHISHASEDMRHRSFAAWKSNSTVTVRSLVEAGFFYLGMKDCVKCFYCDGGLCNWMPRDDPWTEHARWFPNCAFVQLNKGQEFIEECIKDRPPVEPDVNVDQEPSTSGETSPVNLARNIDNLMQSDMVKMFLEAEVFPYQIVHAAVARQLQETGRGFDSEDELCQAVMYLQLNEDAASEETVEDEPVMGARVDCSLESVITTSEVQQPSTSAAMENLQVEPQDHLTGSQEPAPSTIPLVAEAPETNGSGRQDSLLCKICMDKEVGMVFLPCGHLMACTRCGPALKQCPLCRRKINGAVRTFLS